MFKKISSNTISQIISKVWTAIISIFLLSILTNYLSVELFWVYSKIYNYLWIFAFLADLWLYTIAIREISKNEKDSSKIVWNIMSLRLFLGIIILFLALALAYFIPWYNQKIVLISIFIVSIFTIFWLLNSSILSLMQAKLKIEFCFFSAIIWKLVNIWLIAIIVFLMFPNWFLEQNNSLFQNPYDIPFILIILSWLFWIIINTSLNFFYAKKLCPISFKLDWVYIKHIFKISLPYGIALFLSIVCFKIDIILISLLENPGKADLSIALYSLPMKIVEVLMVIWACYLNSILSPITKLFEEKNYKKLKEILSISIQILFSFATIIFVLWIIFRENIIRIIANENYILTEHLFSSADAFLVVLWVIIFYFLSLLFIYIFIASKKEKIILKINIFITILNILWNIVLIPKYSFIWAWITTLISQIILFILCFYYSREVIKFKIPFKFIFINIFFSILIYITLTYIIKNISLWLYLDPIIYWWIAWLVYLVVIYKIFVIQKEKKF